MTTENITIKSNDGALDQDAQCDCVTQNLSYLLKMFLFPILSMRYYNIFIEEIPFWANFFKCLKTLRQYLVGVKKKKKN